MGGNRDMTETLQQEIDDIINQDECPGCYEYRCLSVIGSDLDKAIQELREEISTSYEFSDSQGDWISVKDVLALIGEKSN